MSRIRVEMKVSQGNSYASKVTKSIEKKTRSNSNKSQDSQGRNEGLEKLMLQESGELPSSGDCSGVTVDEISGVQAQCPVVPQPMYDHGMEHHTQEQHGVQLPQPMIPGPGHAYYNYVPPPNIYAHGSPPLPLAGPLQLVYLQPTAHGVNIIPFQATGYPTFSPCSPLGFPAHPHHPVVVQSPQPFLSQGFMNVDSSGMAQSSIPSTTSPPVPGYFIPHPPPPNQSGPDLPSDAHHKTNATTSSYRNFKFFRPWEDKKMSDEECAGIKKAEDFVEDDFPTLQSGLSKLKLK